MPTLQEVRTKVDTWLTNRWPIVVSRQDTYFANHGHYWQGLRTHVGELDYTDVIDAEALGDNLLAHPTDQNATWADAYPTLSTLILPAVFVMDVYENANGWGWVLTVYVRYNGTIYSRSQNGAGDEIDRTLAWHIYDPNPAI